MLGIESMIPFNTNNKKSAQSACKEAEEFGRHFVMGTFFQDPSLLNFTTIVDDTRGLYYSLLFGPRVFAEYTEA
jgi:hypothetical protein